jgi:hypothetical protein
MQDTRVVLCVVAVLLSGCAGGTTDVGHRPRHLIYVHGRIVQEQQNKRPRHPEYGYYEFEKILDTFRSRGFVVSGELRPKSATVSDSADRVVEQVRKLLGSGVRADEITVVGASMGAAITLLASARLRNPEVRFCVLGDCLSRSVSGLVADEGKGPSGQVLAFREASDDLTDGCPAWKDDDKGGSPLLAREIVLHTGLKHGFLYQPLPEWVNPVAKWADDTSQHLSAEPGR